MKEFNKLSLATLNADVMEALQPVLKKHGLLARSVGGRYTTGEFIKKIEFLIKTEDGVKLEDLKAKTVLNRDGRRYGLNIKDLGKVFEFNYQTFEFIGLSDRGWKYPILGKSIKNGKVYKFQESTVKDIKKSKIQRG